MPDGGLEKIAQPTVVVQQHCQIMGEFRLFGGQQLQEAKTLLAIEGICLGKDLFQFLPLLGHITPLERVGRTTRRGPWTSPDPRSERKCLARVRFAQR